MTIETTIYETDRGDEYFVHRHGSDTVQYHVSPDEVDGKVKVIRLSYVDGDYNLAVRYFGDNEHRSIDECVDGFAAECFFDLRPSPAGISSGWQRYGEKQTY